MTSPYQFLYNAFVTDEGYIRYLIMPNKTEGFETQDHYAAVPWGKKLVIIFNGQQLGEVNTVRQAQKFIQDHREASSQTGTVFV